MSAVSAPWLVDSRWPTVPIRYLAKLGTGHTPSRQHPEYWEDCTIPWVTLADVGQLRDGTLNTISTTAEKISLLGISNSSAVIHPAGTVILSRTASVGFSAILGANMATSQDFATWTCGNGLNHKYLFHALRAMAPDLRRLATGSTHKTIYMPDIADLRIPLPSLEDQGWIADFLDTETARIDTTIEARTRTLNLIRERRASLLEEELVAGPIRSGKCAWKPLHALTDSYRPIMYGIVLPGPSVEHGVPIVKGGDIAANRLHPELLCRTTKEIEGRYARSRLRGGDLVIAIRGSVGEVAAVPESLDGANLTQDAARISAGPDVDAQWLSLVLETPSVTAQIAARVTGATIRGINIWDVKRIMIPSVAGPDQRPLVSRVLANLGPYEDLARITAKQIALLKEHRQALITAAVTGQMDVSAARGADVS